MGEEPIVRGDWSLVRVGPPLVTTRIVSRVKEIGAACKRKGLGSQE